MPKKPTQEDVLEALKTCIEPELGKDIVTLGMIANLAINGDEAKFDYVLTTPACPLKAKMEAEAREAVLKVPGISRATINMTAEVKQDRRLDNKLPAGIKNIIAVASGKGGVGKSSVSANLAAALAREGAKVGLLDADVYGPNQPQMFGIRDYVPTADKNNKIEPPENHGVKVFSIGFLVKTDEALIWRGPMLHSAVRQFLQDVKWGELDYLIVDLPPGTGDVQLSLTQTVPLTGALIVTTPQSIALSDVRKAVAMFRKVGVPLLGIVENMRDFACPHCGKTTRIFSEGGGERLSKDQTIPLLGSLPLDPAVCDAGENGVPLVLEKPESPSAQVFRQIARQVASQVSLQNYNRKPAASEQRTEAALPRVNARSTTCGGGA
ncbi:MAG: Mrp/NBP35 family ATP-binding protein [Elusimicrobiota bacterium]